MSKASLEFIREQLCSTNINDTFEIIDQLIADCKEDIIPYLISCLTDKDQRVRSSAALALREQRDDRAVTPLINCVIDPIDSKRCATFVYALETHDCSEHFLDIFKILFYSNFECKINAHNILSEQQFRFDDNNLYHIKRMWNECIEKPNLCPAFEDVKEGIQDDVDSFLCYLTEED